MLLNLAHSWNICLDSTDTTESNVYVWSHLSPWGFFAFLCSIEHSPLPRAPLGHSASILSCCFCTSKAPVMPLLSVFPCHSKFVAGVSSCIPLVWFSLGVLVCTRQSGLLQHQELALFSSPCMQYKCRPGMRALFMHHWPRSTAKQFFAAKKCACHWYVSYFWKQPRLSRISSSFASDQYQSLFFKSQETGTAWFIFWLLLSVALPLPDCKGCFDFFKQNWRMHYPGPGYRIALC